MLKRRKICGSPSRSHVQFLLLLILGLLSWRGFQSLNYWVYMYRTISSGIHMSQVLSAKRVNGSTFLGSVKQPISLGTLVLQPYTTTIRPVLEYASPVWGGLPIYLEEDLQRVQNRCLNVIGLPRDTVESLVTRCQNLTRKEFKRILESTSLHLHLSFLIFSLHSFIHSFVRSFVRSLTHSLIHPSIHPSVRPSVRPPVCMCAFFPSSIRRFSHFSFFFLSLSFLFFLFLVCVSFFLLYIFSSFLFPLVSFLFSQKEELRRCMLA